MIVGYFFSRTTFSSATEKREGFEEMNEILIEKETRIEQLENYINQLLENGKIPSNPGNKKDDLTRIEGIGPKTEKILNENGIINFSQLAEKTLDELRSVLTTAGSVYLRHNPESWPEQAALLASGKKWKSPVFFPLRREQNFPPPKTESTWYQK